MRIITILCQPWLSLSRESLPSFFAQSRLVQHVYEASADTRRLGEYKLISLFCFEEIGSVAQKSGWIRGCLSVLDVQTKLWNNTKRSELLYSCTLYKQPAAAIKSKQQLSASATKRRMSALFHSRETRGNRLTFVEVVFLLAPAVGRAGRALGPKANCTVFAIVAT